MIPDASLMCHDYRHLTDPINESTCHEKNICIKDSDWWFQQIWNIPGASLKHHQAPFPLDLAVRLVRMFSFVGDTVLDPFCGTGTTMIASLRHQRNSIGVETDPEYCRMTARYLKAESGDLFSKVDLSFERSSPEEPVRTVKEDPALYKVKPARAKLE